MSRPEPDPMPSLSQNSEGNEPGEISISELMNQRNSIDDEKKFDLEMNYIEMEEMDFDLPKNIPVHEEELSSPESGEMSN